MTVSKRDAYLHKRFRCEFTKMAACDRKPDPKYQACKKRNAGKKRNGCRAAHLKRLRPCYDAAIETCLKKIPQPLLRKDPLKKKAKRCRVRKRTYEMSASEWRQISKENTACRKRK